ncbi:helix-turn-helix domain-containing protein [Roseateles sp.]|uniref:helix-turn-helix domain-containing protein n=1 Tax=Roseateles sp. TaxID=1971397 RepID=UPI0025F177EF|nr:helix-turn-helix domain-containing protein [Roseateles sp.]MBV8034158.1 AraC family transcriptional regulator [Roseateles sp.]
MHQPSARLWLPPLSLAGCLRGVLLRDTRGLGLQGPALDSYLPATPLMSLYVLARNDAQWLATPGFSVPPPGYSPAPLLLAGPFTQPTHMRSRGEERCLVLLFLPDALRALTGIDPASWRNLAGDAGPVLPVEWRDWAGSLSRMDSEAAQLAAIEAFLQPRWQALGAQRPSGRYADWTEALAMRAATSAAGRSLRQLERRIKAWAGLPMRELRAVSRAEAAFYAVAAAEDRPGFSWAHIAAQADYADQSHLCRETRRLTGFSPEELRRRIATDEAFWAYRLWRG